MESKRRTRRQDLWRELERGGPDDDRPVALITGAAGGLGAAFARQLCDRGWRLVLVDLDGDRLAEVTAWLRLRGGEVEPIEADVAEPLAPRNVVDAAIE